MKSKKGVLIILIALLMIVGIEGFLSYLSNHGYYTQMLSSWRNVILILSALVCACVPIYYMQAEKSPNMKGLTARIGGGLALFSLLHALFLESVVSLPAVFILIFNVSILFIVSVALVFVLFVLGSWISRKLHLFGQIRWQEILMMFGIGIASFLVVMQLIMGIGILYGWLLWIIFVGLFGLFWRECKYFQTYQDALMQPLLELKKMASSKAYRRMILLLLAVSLAYYFFGFNHSYIPYPTAWDANHEYMYTPKVIAENAGILWGNIGAASAMPFLWHGFIAFCFALWKPLSLVLNIAPDTFAVNMNFLSGIIVLVFGLGVISEVIRFFKLYMAEKGTEKSDPIPFFVAWGLLLLWLTSGMGAFLLFVDNKTDMGVLALMVIALLGGFCFLNHFQSKGNQLEERHSIKYLVLSAVFFAFAVMAKPTAFIDVVVFGLLLIGLWLNTMTALGAGIMVFGLMGVIQPLFTAAFLSPALGKVIALIGLILFVIGALRGIFNRKAQFMKWMSVILLWGGVFVFSVFLFKGPWIAIRQMIADEFQVSSFVKATLLGKSSVPQEGSDDVERPLLAQAGESVDFLIQNQIDAEYIDQTSSHLNLAQCKHENFSQKDLDQDKQKAPGSTMNEDFGRYVGFGARAFPKTGVAGLLLKGIFWKNNACYGLNTDAVMLCEHGSMLELRSLEALASLQSKLTHPEGTVAQLVEAVFQASGSIEQNDAFKALSTYVKEHSIVTSEDMVEIPYRYIVPLNAVFNWSLQNLSSYYTDIGLIWIFVFILMGGSTLYALLRLNKKILILNFSVIIGWAIWWAIAAGIVWYGLGLILWSILVVALFIQELRHEEHSFLIANLIGWMLGIFAFYMGVQGLMNLARIASQASTGPFAWYKSNVGIEYQLNDDLTSQQKKSYRYSADRLFALQFGQYSPFIEYVKDRNDQDGVLIAGTYLQYFLQNQRNLRMDGMLSWLWEEMSDYNHCKSYHRLRNQHIKYLVIDPNIGTVGRVGQGNESLFHRFFAKLNADETQLLTPGVMTMLSDFFQEGYVKLIFTNNIGAKYAFSLSDDVLREVVGDVSDEELTLVRAKLAVAKFFVSEEDMSLLQIIFTLFESRFNTQDGLEDVASVLNKHVDVSKVYAALQAYLSGNSRNFSQLSQDERMVVYNYLIIQQSLSAGQGQNFLFQFLQDSIFGSSQIITLELQ